MEKPADEVELVESDGEPMGETELHVDQILDLIAALRRLAVRQGRADVKVGGNLNVYYDPRRRQKRVCPDVFWVTGLKEPRRRRRVYALWDEGKGPDLVIEVASRSTYAEDLGAKKLLYRRVLGVREYVVFDPEGQMPGGPLRAWRLAGSVYRPIGTRAKVHSQVLGATLTVVDGLLRVFDATGAQVPGLPPHADANGPRWSILRVLEARFGPVPAALRARIEALADDALDAALARAATCASLRAFG